MLEVRDLSVSYGGPNVLEHVELEVKAGETVAVLGANTAGKTTLLRTISGLVAKARGTILFEGAPLLGRPAHTIPALGIGHVPEGRHVFPRMSTMDNLMMGAFGDRRASDLQARIDRVLTLFPRLGERRTQMAGSMSGGEQQMVSIGRALMGNPKLLLLDEPLNHLDLHHQIATLELFRRIVRAETDTFDSSGPCRQSGAVLVLHDINLAARYADHVILLDGRGGVIAGDRDSVMRAGLLSQAFGHPLRRFESEGRVVFVPD